jgi:CHASE2 domain-containing sensor protein
MFLGAGLLASLFGLPDALLRYAGLSLIPFAAFVAFMAVRDRVSRPAVLAIIIANVLWVVDSFLLLLTGWVQPSVLGYVFVIGQAVIVAAFAEVQHKGLKAAH